VCCEHRDGGGKVLEEITSAHPLKLRWDRCYDFENMFAKNLKEKIVDSIRTPVFVFAENFNRKFFAVVFAENFSQ
jgi:hypothetical protein